MGPVCSSLPVIAPLGWRVIAAILDFVAIWCVISLIVMAIPVRVLQDGFEQKSPALLIPIGLCCLGLVYYICFETFFGATPGKWISGIQVRRAGSNESCDFRSALLRNLLRIVDAFAGYLVGFLVAVISTSRQRIGDLVAGTIVVRHYMPVIRRILLAGAWVVLASGTFVACQALPRR